MKALQIVKPREFRIIEIDRPKCGPDEVVVRLEYASMCNQNDYKIFYGLYGDLIRYPCDPGVYGHEGAGVVVEAGSAVKELRLGDRVVMMGEGGPMLYMEHVLRKANSVARVAPHVPADEAAVLELFGCAHHCVGIAGDLSGRSVAISGLGPAGLAILQMIRRRNPAEIVAVDVSEERGRLAMKAGAARFVNASDPARLAALVAEGIDVVIDATGVPQAILNAFEITRKEVVIFGFTNEPFLVDQSKWFRKEMVIKNSRVQTLDDLRAAVGMLERGEIETRSLISRVMTFDQYAEAVELLYAKKAVKILLKWS